MVVLGAISFLMLLTAIFRARKALRIVFNRKLISSPIINGLEPKNVLSFIDMNVELGIIIRRLTLFPHFWHLRKAEPLHPLSNGRNKSTLTTYLPS